MRKTRGLVNEQTAWAYVFIRSRLNTNTYKFKYIRTFYHFIELWYINRSLIARLNRMFAFLAMKRLYYSGFFSTKFNYFIKIFLNAFFVLSFDSCECQWFRVHWTWVKGGRDSLVYQLLFYRYCSKDASRWHRIEIDLCPFKWAIDMDTRMCPFNQTHFKFEYNNTDGNFITNTIAIKIESEKNATWKWNNEVD